MHAAECRDRPPVGDRERCALPLFLALAGSFLLPTAPAHAQEPPPQLISLPEVRGAGEVSVEQALSRRYSIRSYEPDALEPGELGQLLWAAQGITRAEPDAPPGFRWEWRGGYRTAPSAGALYPLELHAVVGRVDGLAPGVYRYVPAEHALRLETAGDLRADLATAALGQRTVSAAPVVLVFTGVVARTAAKYGERAPRYVHVEVGAAGQNVYLQCESLGLGTVFVGAFRDEEAARVLGLPEEEEVFLVMPVGRPRE